MNDEPLNKIRRHDRAVNDDAWIIEFLQQADYGVLATCQNGQPFTVARNFAYDPDKHVIYFHGAQKGRTIDNVGAGALANLNVSEMGKLTTGKRAADFGVDYKGVVVFGKLVTITDPDEARRGLQLLMDKHFPGAEYETFSDADLKITAVLRLDIDSWSGKQRFTE